MRFGASGGGLRALRTAGLARVQDVEKQREMAASAISEQELQRFRETFLYRDPAIFFDEVRHVDHDSRTIESVLFTDRSFPLTAAQRTGPHHPAHISAGELVMATGSVGCLHAWYFHGCDWEQGWAGYGGIIHKAEFRSLAYLGPELVLRSREVRTRVGRDRVVLRFDFRILQEDRAVYVGDHTAFFVRTAAEANESSGG